MNVRQAPVLVVVVVAVVVGVALVAGVTQLFSDEEVDSQWLVVRSDPGSTTVVVESLHGGWRLFKEISASQDSNEVRIRVRSSVPGGDCLLYASIKCHSIELGTPLGDREIVGPKKVDRAPTEASGNSLVCQGSMPKVEAKRR